MSTPIQFFSFRSDYTRWIYVFSAHVFQHLTINGYVKDGHRKYKDADPDDNDGDEDDNHNDHDDGSTDDNEYQSRNNRDSNNEC